MCSACDINAQPACCAPRGPRHEAPAFFAAGKTGRDLQKQGGLQKVFEQALINCFRSSQRAPALEQQWPGRSGYLNFTARGPGPSSIHSTRMQPCATFCLAIHASVTSVASACHWLGSGHCHSAWLSSHHTLRSTSAPARRASPHDSRWALWGILYFIGVPARAHSHANRLRLCELLYLS